MLAQLILRHPSTNLLKDEGAIRKRIELILKERRNKEYKERRLQRVKEGFLSFERQQYLKHAYAPASTKTTRMNTPKETRTVDEELEALFASAAIHGAVVLPPDLHSKCVPNVETMQKEQRSII